MWSTNAGIPLCHPKIVDTCTVAAAAAVVVIVLGLFPAMPRPLGLFPFLDTWAGLVVANASSVHEECGPQS